MEGRAPPIVILAPEPEPVTVADGWTPPTDGVMGDGPEEGVGPEDEAGAEPAGIMDTRDLGLTSIDDSGIPHFGFNKQDGLMGSECPRWERKVKKPPDPETRWAVLSEKWEKERICIKR